MKNPIFTREWTKSSDPPLRIRAISLSLMLLTPAVSPSESTIHRKTLLGTGLRFSGFFRRREEVGMDRIGRFLGVFSWDETFGRCFSSYRRTCPFCGESFSCWPVGLLWGLVWKTFVQGKTFVQVNLCSVSLRIRLISEPLPRFNNNYWNIIQEYWGLFLVILQ